MAVTPATPVSYNARRQRIQIRLLVMPAALWLIIFFVVPLLVVVLYSFLTRDRFLQAVLPFTLTNYATVFDASSPYLPILWRSLQIALLTTAICLLVGYPLSFFIATAPKRWQNVFLLLVVVPFWTNFLVRTYAISFVITDEGLINSILVNYLKLIDQPIRMMYTPFAVFLGLVYGYLPFMVLPIYTAIEKFNFRLVEAAHDLGANDVRAFLRVMLPVTLPGVMAGSVLVFIPALGAFVTPDLMGGRQGLMIGNQIKDQVFSTVGKPLGSALSIVMMSIVVIALLVYYRFGDRQGR